MHYYAFLSDESLFTSFPFDVIVFLYIEIYNFEADKHT